MSNHDINQGRGKLYFQIFYHPWRTLGIVVALIVVAFAAWMVLR